MDKAYVHGYDSRENRRLQAQANTLVELLHFDTSYQAGSRVLEAGCGVGAQTVTLARNSPNASFIAIDIKASKTYTEQQKPTAFFVIRFSRRLQPRSEVLNKAVENRVRGSAYDWSSDSNIQRNTPIEGTMNVEIEKLRLEQARHRADLLKWVVIAIGAVISFAVIDYGKLRIEQFRATAENQRELLNAYLKSTESPEPDIWRRKLRLIVNSTGDPQTTLWAQAELKYINNFAALDTLYRETLKVASQLVEPNRINEPDRAQARARYNQLYWADLPYAGESPEVIKAMIAFRNQLLIAEEKGSHSEGNKEWEELNRRLIQLSKALRESSPTKTLNPTGNKPPS